MQLTNILSLLFIAGSALAAPGGVTIKISNNCQKAIQVNQLTNGASHQDSATSLSAGDSKSYTVSSTWGGRFWGRDHCTSGSSDCESGSPASLAEFLLKGSGGKDFYDVSFVDGYNMPISIKPHEGGNGDCGKPACNKLPECSEKFQVKDSNGKMIGCKSACSALDTDEACCRGEYNSPDKCKSTNFATNVKNSCPDVYSYAYDDPTSTFTCTATGYDVTFC
ncbi:unnamed protein product [Cunninghamella echinulata]